jgi:hypothetical protein
VFPAEGRAPGRLVRFLPGELPRDPAERKRDKPDVEALALLPPGAGRPGGALLALESGSRPQRRGGVLWGLGARGELAGEPRRLDLRPLYETLEREIPDMNIEGATVARDRLLLFQRGNGRAGVNAVVELGLEAALRDLREGGLADNAVEGITRHDLGAAEGIRLCFSDATSLADGRVLFTAVAEAGDDTYLDGALMGAGVGVLTAGGRLGDWHALDPPAKVEGIEAHEAHDGLRVLLVADADDPSKPSPLLSGRLEIRTGG